jgi:hypothetical protein
MAKTASEQLRENLDDKYEPCLLKAREITMFGIPLNNLDHNALMSVFGWLYQEYTRVDNERHRLSMKQFDWARPSQANRGGVK